MYAHIRGNVEEVFLDRVVIDAGGVGYELFCSTSTLRRLKGGEAAKLLTHFHLTQDSMTLYGFLTEEEKTLFRRLISVTRVGPKLALSVLGTLSVADVTSAIFTQNAAAFERVSGMGKKTAARVLLELKEKIDSEQVLSSAAQTGSSEAGMRAEAIAALVALGYDGVSAGRAVAEVGECAKVEEMITLALRAMAGRKT